MKKIYGVQVLLGLLLCLIGAYLEQEQKRLVAVFFELGYEAGPYGDPSLYFAIIAGVFCLFSLLIGNETRKRNPKLGWFLCLMSLGFTLFAVAMSLSPRGISLEESLWAWYLYSIAQGIGAIVAARNTTTVSSLQAIDDNDILDDWF